MALSAMFAALLSHAFVQDTSNAPAAREWNQPRGNAACTAALDLDPLETTPVELTDYLRAWHRGDCPAKGWQALGFEYAQSLETEFQAFLREAGG